MSGHCSVRTHTADEQVQPGLLYLGVLQNGSEISALTTFRAPELPSVVECLYLKAFLKIEMQMPVADIKCTLGIYQ